MGPHLCSFRSIQLAAPSNTGLSSVLVMRGDHHVMWGHMHLSDVPVLGFKPKTMALVTSRQGRESSSVKGHWAQSELSQAELMHASGSAHAQLPIACHARAHKGFWVTVWSIFVFIFCGWNEGAPECHPDCFGTQI